MLQEAKLRNCQRTSEKPEHRTNSIDVLFFMLRPECLLQEAQLPMPSITPPGLPHHGYVRTPAATAATWPNPWRKLWTWAQELSVWNGKLQFARPTGRNTPLREKSDEELFFFCHGCFPDDLKGRVRRAVRQYKDNGFRVTIKLEAVG
jgi:hypothetical protein